MSEERPITKNKSELEEFLKTIVIGTDNLDFKVTTMKGLSLFTCKGTVEYNIVKIESKKCPDTERIILAGMISGIIHVQIALTGNNSNKLGLEEFFTTHHASDFVSKFSNITKGRILIPDTNVIIDRYISSLRFTLGNDLIKKLSISIPRLAILEIERTANNAKSESDIEKRNKIISSAAELQFLKENGADLLPALEKETFEAFNRVAKDPLTDSWIRREVQEAIKKEQYLKESDKIRKLTLFTADLVNSLSAAAEGIDCIFISKVDYDKTSTRSSNLEQITQLIIMTAIFYREIRASINNRRFIFRGNWEGKTSLEWLRDTIRLVELTNK